jgi:hypothetical protein
MAQKPLMTWDEMMEEISRVRSELVRRHGGLDGYVTHLMAMDRERARKKKQAAAKKAASSKTKGKRKSRSSPAARNGRPAVQTTSSATKSPARKRPSRAAAKSVRKKRNDA